MSGKSYFSLNFGDGTSIRDESNKELLTFDVNGSATNNLQITNNAVGSNVSIDVIGEAADIGLNLNPKGHGKVNILGSTSNTGGIRIYGSGDNKEGANHVGLTVSSSLTSDITFTLPTSDGSSGQVLQTDGSGALSFTDAGSGTPAGNDTEIQFNDGGNFGSSGNLTWNDTNLILGNGSGVTFGDAGENIVGDGADLYLNSSNSINLAPSANVTITSGKNLEFGVGSGETISGDGTDLTVASGNILNLTPGSTSNVVITQGSLVLSTSSAITSASTTEGSPTILAPVQCVSLYSLSGTDTAHYVSVDGQPCTNGQFWNILFDVSSGTPSLRIDFGSDGLATGSGDAQYLTFNTGGQSASLIYHTNKWRIINTGAAVS